jgi:antitoxin MazE
MSRQLSGEPVVTEAVLDIKQWGNNLGVRLPAAVAREANLHVNQRVHIAVAGGQVVITPVLAAPLSLAQRLALYDPARHGGEVMATAMVGVERW